MSHIWTTQEDELLKDLHKQNVSNKDIAAELGRTVTAIDSRMRKFDLVKRKVKYFTKEEDDMIIKMHHQGLTPSEIAKFLNRPTASINARIDRCVFF